VVGEVAFEVIAGSIRDRLTALVRQRGTLVFTADRPTPSPSMAEQSSSSSGPIAITWLTNAARARGHGFPWGWPGRRRRCPLAEARLRRRCRT
jgi:hypothetical protein